MFLPLLVCLFLSKIIMTVMNELNEDDCKQMWRAYRRTSPVTSKPRINFTRGVGG